MVKPWEISADVIQAWASHIDAPAVLPRLVRRLLLATTPLDAIALRADAGTRYEGWDGIVRARAGSAFCPEGLSVWELSVEKKVRSKLKKDHDARTQTPPEGVRPALASYIAVTARRLAGNTARGLSGKEDWARARRAEGIWADVRVYDADDLATWLEQAPAVARWFAHLLGQPSYEVRDVEAFLEAWRKRTVPSLPSELVLGGEARQAQSDELLAALRAPPGRPLILRGRTRDESLLFAAATLAREPGAEARLARALLVETEAAMRWALRVQSAEPLILVPTFEKPDVGEAVAAKVRVLLAGDRSLPVQHGSTLTLEEQPYPPLARILASAGWSAPDAERLVRQAGGNLDVLQRLCGYVDFKPPPWAKDSPRAELLALLLAGAWVPTSTGDREILRRLGGDPAVVEQLCVDLQARGVVTRVAEHGHRDVLRWSAPAFAWEALVTGLTDGHLERFREVVMEVLGAADPAYELRKEERYLAAVKGKTLPHSREARQGLAESLARLSLSDERLAETLGRGRGAALAEGLVRWLLRPEQGWVAWASLSELLPILAEAAPLRFLDRAEASLDQGDDGVARLFLEEASLFGAAPHTGLLWALEVLAWHPDSSVRLRVIRALTRLDARYPRGEQGRVDNRPIQSLDTLLRYAMPRSRTTVEERIALFQQVFRQHAPTGRELGLGMLRNLRGTILIHQGHDPEIHPEWAPEEKTTDVDMAGVSLQVRAIIEALVKDAGADPERWAALLEVVLDGPEDVEEVVLDTLKERREKIDDQEGRIWARLREVLVRLEGDEEPGAERVARLNALCEAFTPPDFSRRHAWRFESFPRIPGWIRLDDEERTRRVDELRAEAVQELWQRPDRWEALAALAREVGKVGHGTFFLGLTLGKSSHADELEPRILDDAADGILAPLLPGFAAARVKAQGLSWLEQILRRRVTESRITEAARVAIHAGQGRGLWDLLERIGEPLFAEYWRNTPGIFGEVSAEDLQYATEHLLAVGREHAAIEAVAIHHGVATGTVAFNVLERYAARLKSARSHVSHDASASMTAGYIDWLFAIIDRDPPASKHPAHDIAPLELFFLPILSESESSRPTRYVSLAFGENPRLFVQLITTLYRRAAEEPPVDEDERRLQAARNALTILNAWKGYPGEGLPEPERDEKLESWAAEVLQKTDEEGRGRGGSTHVAEVLARVPPSSDGFWPCLAARRLLETGLYPHLADGLSLAKRNLRGLTGRALTEGGAQERELAQAYLEAARQLELTYPRTATLLDGLARYYDADAEREDAIARRNQIEHGEQVDEDDEEPAPSSPRDPASTRHADFVSRIVTTDVGPSSHFDVPLHPRLNLWLGENSTGKTFLLDVLWWTLTGGWADLPAKPQALQRGRRTATHPSILAEAGGRKVRAEYDRAKDIWKKRGRPLAPGLTVYARVDGRFAVWDPIRNARPAEKSEQDLSRGYHFTPRTLWYGLDARDGKTRLCRGLLEDAVSWRHERRKAFALLEKALATLSPPGESLRFGRPRRFKVRDALTYPTLDLGYDASVFAVHASAAVKRILGLAYALVWAVSELQEAAAVAGLAPLRRVTLLADELESHLHPRWQRAILPALLAVMEDLAPEAEVQLIVTTHAPLVLASVETLFDEDRDLLLELSPQAGAGGKEVRVVKEHWERLGDANTWLMQHFGLKQPRSREAEEIIEAAARAIEDPKLTMREGRALHQRLREVLGELDPFWVRWRFIAEKRGWV
ncbi:MAG TPA: AAA family ATPase [Candidatus Nanopelagicales bacterium]|nr:AAA family ATPase [Candidatus Nanopelagicales bacterium]